jgi:hypothetical protein
LSAKAAREANNAPAAAHARINTHVAWLCVAVGHRTRHGRELHACLHNSDVTINYEHQSMEMRLFFDNGRRPAFYWMGKFTTTLLQQGDYDKKGLTICLHLMILKKVEN